MRSNFETTHWSIVQASTGNDTQAKEALSLLCEVYYEPVRAFIHSWVNAKDRLLSGGKNVDDLVHDFFVFLLDKGVGHPEEKKGRFRTYLLKRVKYFLCNESRKDRTQRRGGNAIQISLDSEEVADLFLEGRSLPQDEIFEWQWANTTVKMALERTLCKTDCPRFFLQWILRSPTSEEKEILFHDPDYLMNSSNHSDSFDHSVESGSFAGSNHSDNFDQSSNFSSFASSDHFASPVNSVDSSSFTSSDHLDRSDNSVESGSSNCFKNAARSFAAVTKGGHNSEEKKPKIYEDPDQKDHEISPKKKIKKDDTATKNSAEKSKHHQEDRYNETSLRVQIYRLRTVFKKEVRALVKSGLSPNVTSAEIDEECACPIHFLTR